MTLVVRDSFKRLSEWLAVRLLDQRGVGARLGAACHHQGKRDFGREVRRRFDTDEQHACEVTKAAPSSDTRPEIVSPLSGSALLMLSSRQRCLRNDP
jgi:hypothetical protein